MWWWRGQGHFLEWEDRKDIELIDFVERSTVSWVARGLNCHRKHRDIRYDRCSLGYTRTHTHTHTRVLCTAHRCSFMAFAASFLLSSRGKVLFSYRHAFLLAGEESGNNIEISHIRSRKINERIPDPFDESIARSSKSRSPPTDEQLSLRTRVRCLVIRTGTRRGYERN